MNFIKRLLSAAHWNADSGIESAEEAVLLYLDIEGLPSEVYSQYDLATLENRLTAVIKKGQLGEYDGNEIGPQKAELFMYGPDADLLYAGIEPVVRTYPLCKGARVVIRKGGPGAPEREIRL